MSKNWSKRTKMGKKKIEKNYQKIVTSSTVCCRKNAAKIDKNSENRQRWVKSGKKLTNDKKIGEKFYFF